MQRLTARITAFRDARDWQQFHGLKDEALSLMIEAGELAEHLRWHDDAALRARIAEDPEPVADELADVFYWTLLIAHDLGIDLEAAFERKMLQNERKYPVAAVKLSEETTGAALRGTVRPVHPRRDLRDDLAQARGRLSAALPAPAGRQ